jgi:hypothetical protein
VFCARFPAEASTPSVQHDFDHYKKVVVVNKVINTLEWRLQSVLRQISG